MGLDSPECRPSPIHVGLIAKNRHTHDDDVNSQSDMEVMISDWALESGYVFDSVCYKK